MFSWRTCPCFAWRRAPALIYWYTRVIYKGEEDTCLGSREWYMLLKAVFTVLVWNWQAQRGLTLFLLADSRGAVPAQLSSGPAQPQKSLMWKFNYPQLRLIPCPQVWGVLGRGAAQCHGKAAPAGLPVPGGAPAGLQGWDEAAGPCEQRCRAGLGSRRFAAAVPGSGGAELPCPAAERPSAAPQGGGWGARTAPGGTGLRSELSELKGGP